MWPVKLAAATRGVGRAIEILGRFIQPRVWRKVSQSNWPATADFVASLTAKSESLYDARMNEEHPEPRIVPVYRCRHEMLAHMLVNYLKSMGVPAAVGGSPTLVAMLGPDDPTATIDVLVAEEDAENARFLIEEKQRSIAAAREPGPELETVSPALKVLRRLAIALFIAACCMLLLAAVSSLLSWLPFRHP